MVKMIRRVCKIHTKLEYSKFTAEWRISEYKEFASEMENGTCLQTGNVDMQINEAKCSLTMYPHGKSEDDKDSISVEVQFADDTFLMSGKIKITLFDGSEMPLKEMEKDVMLSGADSVTFESVMPSDDTINNMIITCEMEGKFKVDEVKWFDVNDEDCDESNVVSPLR